MLEILVDAGLRVKAVPRAPPPDYNRERTIITR